MAISVSWRDSIITVPRTDMVLIQSVPTEIRQLDLNAFRLSLRDLEDSSDGMAFQRTHTHNTTVSVGGVILARVITILEPYTVTFEDGQYAVNLVGANSNVGDRVNVNQVSVRSANSAGLQDLSTLLDAAYNGEVAIDTVTSVGQPGVSTPIGTRARPSNNFADAITIAERISARTLRLLQSATLSVSDFSVGYNFFGDGVPIVILTILPGANVSRCEFKNLTIQGELDNHNVIKECRVFDIDYTNGIIWQCALSGSIVLAPGASAVIAESFSNIETINIDLAGTGSLVLSEFNGSVRLSNFSGSGIVALDIASGSVTIDSTVTAGTITIRGSADVVDNSTGTTVVEDLTINKRLGMPGEVVNVPDANGGLLEQVGYLVAKTANESNIDANDLQTLRNRANTSDIVQTQLTRTATTFKKGRDVDVP